MFCYNCGKQLSDDSVFCTHCGVRVETSQNDQQYSEQKKLPSLTQLKEKANEITPKSKLSKKKIIVIVVAAVVLIAVINMVINNVFSGAGAKCKVLMDNGVTFKLFYDIDIMDDSDSMITLDDEYSSVSLYDEKEDYLGEVTWDSKEEDSKSEAKKEFSEYTMLYEASGANVDSITAHGIKINIFYEEDDDSENDEYDAIFVVDNYFYEIQFEELDYDDVKKILKTVNN